MHPHLFAVRYFPCVEVLDTRAEVHHSSEQNTNSVEHHHIEVELFVRNLQVFATEHASAQTSGLATLVTVAYSKDCLASPLLNKENQAANDQNPGEYSIQAKNPNTVLGRRVCLAAVT